MQLILTHFSVQSAQLFSWPQKTSITSWTQEYYYYYYYYYYLLLIINY